MYVRINQMAEIQGFWNREKRVRCAAWFCPLIDPNIQELLETVQSLLYWKINVLYLWIKCSLNVGPSRAQMKKQFFMLVRLLFSFGSFSFGHAKENEHEWKIKSKDFRQFLINIAFYCVNVFVILFVFIPWLYLLFLLFGNRSID